MARRLRKSAYGNYIGYIGINLFLNFGDDLRFAEYWLATGIADRNQAYNTRV